MANNFITAAVFGLGIRIIDTFAAILGNRDTAFNCGNPQARRAPIRHWGRKARIH
ncbi:hypothetical protein GCM10009108_24070 [Castellaniella ginsengisoli]|uniref:Uncharacterized protein n=1 Tax=Castellaniella ginsengisoli TaxID=546114 RepID=A0ABN1L176_9BURK